MRYAVPTSLWRRPKPSVAWAFGGVKVPRTFTLLPPHPLDLCLVPLRPWVFQLEKQKAPLFLHFSNTWMFEKCAVDPSTALARD